MAIATSKVQITIQKHLAERYRISPVDVIEKVPTGDRIRVITGAITLPGTTVEERLCSFDPRFPEKQRYTTQILRGGTQQDTLRLPHQTLVEFAAVAIRNYLLP